MKKKRIIFCAAVIAALFNFCSNPVESIEKPIKDPRTMTWTVDTLSYPGEQILITSVWGSSPSDVYICGHNSMAIEGKLWHYDGSILEEIKLSEKLPLIGHDLTKVFGFSKNDVWVIGGQGVPDPRHIVGTVETPLIVHFDGVNWKEYMLNFYKDHTPGLLGINGDRPDNLWVCGFDGLVAHFDGTKWTQDTVKIDNSGLEFNLVSVALYNNQVYLLGQQFNPLVSPNRFYSINGTIKNWKVIDSFWANETAKFGYSNLYTNFGKLYSLVPDVYEYSNGSWTPVIKLPSNYVSFFMSGTSEDNILIGSFNGLFHWNGKDIKQMDLPNYHYGDWVWEIWYDGQEAFAVGNSYFDATKSFFWHGK